MPFLFTVPEALDQPCEWNSDCFGLLTECRPAKGTANTTCQCLLYHTQVHQNICIPGKLVAMFVTKQW